MANSATIAEIERVGSLQALNDTHASTRRARPPNMVMSMGHEQNRVPLNTAKLQRQASKGGLRGMFTRTKVDKSLVLPVEEEPTLFSNPEKSIMETIAQKRASQNFPMKRASTVVDATPAMPVTPQKPASKPSRMNLRSAKQAKPATRPALKTPPKNTSKQPTRTSTAWDPPPLFQAYPQAIKHAHLSASTLSADSILRISNHKRTTSIRDELTWGKDDGQIQSAAAKKTEKAKSKHRRQISGSLTGAGWTQKIFVLVCASCKNISLSPKSYEV